MLKLLDGKCWMTQNLRIVNKTLTPYDSDVSHNFVLTSNDASIWDTNGEISKVYIYPNTGADYGNYYSWFAATAGSGTISLSDGDNAASSICSSGWHLPTVDEYRTLTPLYTSGKALQSPINYKMVGAYRGGHVWYCPLCYGYSETIHHSGYWTATRGEVNTNCQLAWTMLVFDGSFYVQNGWSCIGDGGAMRCLAD